MAKKKGALRHIHVDPNDDGTAQIHAHRKPVPMDGAKSNGGMAPMDYDGGDEKVGAGSPEEAGAHVTRMLKEHFGKSDGDADDRYGKHPASKVFGR